MAQKSAEIILALKLKSNYLKFELCCVSTKLVIFLTNWLSRILLYHVHHLNFCKYCWVQILLWWL